MDIVVVHLEKNKVVCASETTPDQPDHRTYPPPSRPLWTPIGRVLFGPDRYRLMPMGLLKLSSIALSCIKHQANYVVAETYIDYQLIHKQNATNMYE